MNNIQIIKKYEYTTLTKFVLNISTGVKITQIHPLWLFGVADRNSYFAMDQYQQE